MTTGCSCSQPLIARGSLKNRLRDICRKLKAALFWETHTAIVKPPSNGDYGNNPFNNSTVSLYAGGVHPSNGEKLNGETFSNIILSKINGDNDF